MAASTADQSAQQSKPQYTHGHHPAVVSAHSWRTAANSLAFLLPHLQPNHRVLDIGCGPGTITCDIASEHVAKGYVTGLDASDSVIAQATKLAGERGVQNVTFLAGDAYNLSYGDGEFDVVFCHQVLQHVHDPVELLREMKRVCKTDGIVAARESDYDGFTWYPASEGLDEWRRVYRTVARGNGGEPNAGRMVHVWAKEAGFAKEKIKCSVNSWCYATKEEVQWWSGTWAERTAGEGSALAKSAVEKGAVKGKEDLQVLGKAWREWGENEDAWFAVPSGEVVCRND